LVPIRRACYQALAEADLHPDWVAGISIGAINSAIIAGNPPEERVAKLRAFWEGITTNPLFDWTAAADRFAPKGDIARSFFNQMSAAWALVGGAPGFFTPAPTGTMAATDRLPRSDELLQDQAPQGDARTTRRLRTHQFG
jgi:predicted acylesterase/phospholipase RssA